MPKHPSKRQRRNVSPMSVVQGERVDAPDPDRRWLKVTKDAHDQFWGSLIAAQVRIQDLDTVRRMFGLKDDYERHMRLARKEPFVQGSMGQPILNPSAKFAKELLSEIRQLEMQFGLTPGSRARIMQSEVSVARGVADLNAGVSNDDEPFIDIAGRSDTGS